ERQCFTIEFQPPMEAVRSGNYEQDVLANTARFTAAIERFVRNYPDQWLWIHKRWQTRPAGEENFYTKHSAAQIASENLTAINKNLFEA
ncbi:MAG: hypothetical protein H0T92_01960, partial [Pyrinomonadaceae bacterium]|nr:hypothetical protein [Pyrinomonadaceae bacterium]